MYFFFSRKCSTHRGPPSVSNQNGGSNRKLWNPVSVPARIALRCPVNNTRAGPQRQERSEKPKKTSSGKKKGEWQNSGGVVGNDAPRHRVRSRREKRLLKVSRPLPLKGQSGEGSVCRNRVTRCRWISDAGVGPAWRAELCSHGVL